MQNGSYIAPLSSYLTRIILAVALSFRLGLCFLGIRAREERLCILEEPRPRFTSQPEGEPLIQKCEGIGRSVELTVA